MLFRATAAVLTLLSFAAAPVTAQENPIVRENRQPGTRDWLLTKVDTVLVEHNLLGEHSPHYARSARIEGFVSRTSYAAGDTIEFFVSTAPASDYTIDVYRMGYYQGLGGRLMHTSPPQPGRPQPLPADGERNLREAKWNAGYTLRVPDDWLSGVYLGKLTRQADGFQAYVVFVVRDERRADFNFQVSDLTWQAYNRWPAWRSLYDFQGRLWNTSGGDIVSFDRPYGFYFNLLPSGPNALTNGSGEFLLWEFPLAYWMEEQGCDVTYTSNLDTHRHPDALLRTKAFLSVGHDEYWTRQMYDNVTRARDAGVNLLFLSGNAVDGEVFLTASTDGRRPERILGRSRWLVESRELMGATSYGVGLGDWVVQDAGHWLYSGTGLEEGDLIRQLVGWEYHGYPLREDPTLRVLAHANFRDDRDKPEHGHAATIYDGPQGNFVFNAGTCWWSMLLARPPGAVNPPDVDFSQPDPRVQQMTRNLLDRARRPPTR